MDQFLNHRESEEDKKKHSILGNSDKMLFYMKELAAAGEDDQATHNPYLLTKLNLKTVKNFSFDAYQKALIEQ